MKRKRIRKTIFLITFSIMYYLINDWKILEVGKWKRYHNSIT